MLYTNNNNINILIITHFPSLKSYTLHREMVDNIVKKINHEDHVEAVKRKEMQEATAKMVRDYEVQVSSSFRGVKKAIYSILVLSFFMCGGALDSYGFLLSYPITSLASPITIILISTLF